MRPIGQMKEYLTERKQKAERLDIKGEELEGRDLLTTQDKGHYMRAEAEARKDELDRIYNEFFEKGD